MGWDREGIHPGNHLMCRVMWGGYMQADGEGAAFNHDTLEGVCNPDGLKQGSWGVVHELGHVNQMQLDFCWAGMTEVTNNLFSQWCIYNMNPRFVRLDHAPDPTHDGQTMSGACYDRFVNRAVLQNRLWQFHSRGAGGPDAPGKEGGEGWATLCPLWQLLLYCQVARGNDAFYPEIFRQMRATGKHPLTHGQARVNFCRFACHAAKLDLSDYMLRTGMLGLINREVGDYINHMVTVTPDMVVEAVKEASQYPGPDSSVIFYITVNSVGIYRDRLPVKPSRDFRPHIPAAGGNIIFPAGKWENAVAFEVYKGDKLIRICLRGLGQEDNASTTVICPPGATAIRAVQWDGTRYLVVQKGKRRPGQAH